MSNSLRETVVIMGLAIASSMALCFTALANTIGERNSTESILACRAMDKLNPHPEVTVMGVSNFTAEFYSRANHFLKPVSVNVLPDFNSDISGIDDIIIRRSQLKEAAPNLGQEFDETSKNGRWVWMHRKSIPLEIDECVENESFDFNLLKLKDKH